MPANISEDRVAVERYLAQRIPPPLPARVAGRIGSRLIVSAPWLWPLLRRPTRRLWNRMARRWDQAIKPDSPDHLAPLDRACECLDVPPSRVLDIGIGTGAGALMLARRFPDAQVVGVDISDVMVRAALAKRSADLTDRVDFAVVDGASLPYEPGTFDLVTQCNMPPFIAEVARVLRPGGSHVIADSLGSGTPSFTPRRILRRAVERCGLQTIADGRAGAGTFFVARKPGGVMR